jgi:hypothetical protein
MYQSTFGTKSQVSFRNEHEYYELLGFLAKSNNTVSITWEHNEQQGAWGSEGRLEFYAVNRPITATLSHTAGNGGSIISRVNCNDFVQNLNKNHAFVWGKDQPIDEIRTTIPAEYLTDFERGLTL